MAILRNPRKQNFTTICNDALKDKRLSLKARGLLASMMSLPDNWEFSEVGLEKIFPNDGATSIKSGLKELEQAGYLFRERCRGDGGRLANAVWTISDSPMSGNPTLEKPTLENPTLVKPTLDKPITENHEQLNNNQLTTKRVSNKESNTQEGVPSWADDPELSPKMIFAISDWLKYKAERRESYKPTGLKSLISKVKQEVRQYGEDQVIDVMVLSMGNGYQGICYSKLKGLERVSKPEPPKQVPPDDGLNYGVWF